MKSLQYDDSVTGESKKIEFSTKNITIVGSNGSGKSSFFKMLSAQNSDWVQISAQKNLTINQSQFKGMADEWLKQNITQYYNSQGGSHSSIAISNNFIQNDFNQSIENIFREYTDVVVSNSINGVLEKDTKTNLRRVLELWNSIFTDKALGYHDRKLQVKLNDAEYYYDIENLSEGERSILYTAIKILQAKSNSCIMIDEPETFLNPALLHQLYDLCEELRSDCTFIYFSHDLEFITSRKDNTIFWIKDFRYINSWQIEKLDDTLFPAELLLKIIGTKVEKILFVESESNKDTRLYQKVYPDFKVWGVGSCENVINYTKAFNKSKIEKFDKMYFGLIDKDLKTDEEIQTLRQNKIFTIPIAIYESLYLVPPVIKFVFEHDGRSGDFDKALLKLTKKLKELIKLPHFKNAYTKDRLKQYFNQNIDSLAKKSLFEPDFASIETEIASLCNLNYDEILKFFNQKDVKKLTTELGYTFKSWEDRILNLFNTDKEDNLRTVFKQIIGEIN